MVKHAGEVIGYSLCAGVLLLACLNPNILPTPTTHASECRYRYSHSGDVLPDPICTPGETNPAVTQANIASTICKRGWTSTVRPPVDYTEPLKLRQMHDYAASGRPSQYEEDHLIPLELGGHPTDPKNLWPQPGSSPNAKDRMENTLNRRVCNGTMSLGEAQYRIAADWTVADLSVPIPPPAVPRR